MGDNIYANMDWDKLRKQKITLYRLLDENCDNDITKADLDGVIGMIDTIQDHAVDVCGISEDKVFGIDDKTYINNPEHCPVCKSDQIERSSDFHDGGNEVDTSRKCTYCGAEWGEVYKLVEIKMLTKVRRGA